MGTMLRTCLRGLRGLRGLRCGKFAAPRPIRSSLPPRSSYLHPRTTFGFGSRHSTFVYAAKEIENSSSVDYTPDKKTEPWAHVDQIMLLLLIAESYYRETDKGLMPDANIADIAELIFRAPFCLMVHDYTGEEEFAVKFLYANNAALNMMGGEWEDIVGQPSPFFDKDTLDKALDEGYLPGLSVKVRTLDGSQIELQNVDIINISDPSDEVVAQMIMFHKWLLEDGTEAGPGYVPDNQVPSDKQITDAQERVDTLAAHVRDLKETQGMDNDNPVVKDAVAELLQAKETLTKMQDLINRAAEQKKKNSDNGSV